MFSLHFPSFGYSSMGAGYPTDQLAFPELSSTPAPAPMPESFLGLSMDPTDDAHSVSKKALSVIRKRKDYLSGDAEGSATKKACQKDAPALSIIQKAAHKEDRSDVLHMDEDEDSATKKTSYIEDHADTATQVVLPIVDRADVLHMEEDEDSATKKTSHIEDHADTQVLHMKEDEDSSTQDASHKEEPTDIIAKINWLFEHFSLDDASKKLQSAVISLGAVGEMLQAKFSASSTEEIFKKFPALEDKISSQFADLNVTDLS
jgi:hypothetical protein